MVKLGLALKKQLTHLSLCTLGKTPRQSQKSSTVLMKPSEQTLSNAASMLLPCMREHATQARESSDQRSVCPTGKISSAPKPDSFYSYKSSGINNTGIVLAQGNITYRDNTVMSPE